MKSACLVTATMVLTLAAPTRTAGSDAVKRALGREQ